MPNHIDSFLKKVFLHSFFASGLLILSTPLIIYYPVYYPVLSLFAVVSIYFSQKLAANKNDILNQAIKSSPILIYVLSLKSENIIYSNEESKKALGYSQEQLIAFGENVLHKLAHLDDLELIEKSKRMIGLLQDGEYVDLKFRLKDSNGNYKQFKNRFAPFRRDSEGNILQVVSFSEDVSHEAALEKEIEVEKIKVIHNEKFAALGEMAGGIAHEINNPLAIIMGHTQSLKMKITSGNLNETDVLKSLDKIENTTKRINKIVNSLRMIARDGLDDDFSNVVMPIFIDDIKSFWEQRLINSNIQLIIDPYDEKMTAYCKPVQIILVLLNLIGNAYHAIKDSTDEKWIRVNISSSENNLYIKVIDSGEGIPENIRHKIFDPFFTTKAAGEGTGLGLSISAGIAKVNKGSLTLDPTNPNTCFVLTLNCNDLDLKKVS